MDKPSASVPTASATDDLFVHAAAGRLDSIRQAVERGADIDARHGTNRMTSLHKALSQQKGDAVRYLLAQGANPNIGTIRGYTPLHTAASSNDAGVAELLLDYGADPNVYNISGTLSSLGETPLLSASQRNSLATLRQLLRAGADPLLPVERKERIRDTVPDTFTAALAELQHYEELPRISGVETVTRAELLVTDAEGRCPLDNPVTWRQWDAISRQLEARGERFDKQELQREGADGRSYLAIAAEARSLDAVVRGLNRHGEALELADLHGMEPTFERAHVPRAVFCESNMRLFGREGCRRNLDALPEAGRALLDNRFALSTAVARAEMTYSPVRGR